MTLNNLRKIILFLVSLNALSFLHVAAQPVNKLTKAKQPVLFLNVLKKRLAESDLTIEKFCPPDNIFTRRIVSEYGAVFVGKGKFAVSCYLKDENTVQQTQKQLGISSQIIGGVKIELQPAAMEALLKAIAEAGKQGLTITPKGGSTAARRSFSETVSFWSSRVEPGLKHWVKEGRLTSRQAERIRLMPTFEQVVAILQLEEKEIYFSTYFDKSILYSVAAPGASQHNLMLAFDVSQFADAKTRRVLAKHGWFQTVASDKPHFTYIGVEEDKLPSLGLHSVLIEGQIFWIPQMEAVQ